MGKDNVFFNLLKKLPEHIRLSNGIEMELDNKKHQGVGNLEDIQWYEYKIRNFDELDEKYDNVCLSGFIITEDIRKASSESIITKGVSEKQTIRPHIDYKTGNIHPSKEYIEGNIDGNIKQLVLCNGLGPRTGIHGNIVNENVYFYRNTPRQKGCLIHKACYYPLITDDESVKRDWRYIMLSEIWEKIQFAIKQ